MKRLRGPLPALSDGCQSSANDGHYRELQKRIVPLRMVMLPSQRLPRPGAPPTLDRGRRAGLRADVSIQAQIVNLLADLRDAFNLTYVFIAHDLSVVRQVSSRVAVMYMGSIVEQGPTDAVFASPRHHYTAALRSAVPIPSAEHRPSQRIVLKGDPPSPINPPPGCRFHTRCAAATSVCREERPTLTLAAQNHLVACHHPRAS